MTAGEVLWTPPADVLEWSQVGRFMQWLRDHRDLDFPDYPSLWRWSVDDLEAFWGAIADYFGVEWATPYERVLADDTMPGAKWFPGATLNYAQHVLKGARVTAAATGGDVLRARSQTRGPLNVGADEFVAAVACARAGLVRLGVGRGDRVVAYMPNIPETMVAFLACASLGAVWASCAPEFGTRSVVDRLQQIEPKVLLTIDGYMFGDKKVDRTGEVAGIRAELPSLSACVALPYLWPDEMRVPDAVSWAEFTDPEGVDLTTVPCEMVPFDHPLYILYSSGTTGLPKPIVHGHGGILLEHLKSHAFHADLGAGDWAFYFSTTGWMVWNWLVSCIAVGAGVVLFDGNPGYPDLGTLWRLAGETRVTMYGGAAPFYLNCRKAGLVPTAIADLSSIRFISSTGAPLPPEGFRWIYEVFPPHVLLSSTSGGTDICGAFVGAVPLMPVWCGEITAPALGCKVESFDPEGKPVTGEQGELVITAPMPSMPVGFWNDPDGSRYRAAYFEDFPGVWRHGDWITMSDRGSSVISGRSDATLNRGGVRLGTSEFYSVVEGFAEVADSLVVHLEDSEGGLGELILFVVTTPGVQGSDDLTKRIAAALKTSLSPRHIPDRLHYVPAVPRTLSGKKLEVPVKRILTGTPPEVAASKGALANPESLEHYVALARERAGR